MTAEPTTPEDEAPRRVEVEVLPPSPATAPMPAEPELGTEETPRRRQFKRALRIAFLIAAVSDGLSIMLALAPPFQMAVDLGTAVLLFAVLGWRWPILPGLLMEAIPGVYLFPFWILVVGAIAVIGNPRPKMN